jgi:hypothetical protein
MRERPILFSAEMVRAILEGRKTMTRRVMRPQPVGVPNQHSETDEWLDIWYTNDAQRDPSIERSEALHNPYGVPGDRLWVREAFRLTDEQPPWVIYAADSTMRAPDGSCRGHVYQGPWRPSIHMPRWASRLTLEITDVRVQRVREISEEDAIAEGCEAELDWTARMRFAELWNHINAKRGYGWDVNPWVWCLTFRRLPNAA